MARDIPALTAESGTLTAGVVTLGGALSGGFQTFADGMTADGNTVHVIVKDASDVHSWRDATWDQTAGTLTLGTERGNTGTLSDGAVEVWAAPREDAARPSGYIYGAPITRVDNNTIAIGAPCEFTVPSTGAVVRADSDVSATISGIAPNTWYHVYGYDDGSGGVAVEIVTTAPAAPYVGSARAKSGDTTRRYLGSVRTRPSAAELVEWTFADGVIWWDEGMYDTAFRRVLLSGTAVSPSSPHVGTAINLDSAVPDIGVNRAWISCNNTDTDQTVAFKGLSSDFDQNVDWYVSRSSGNGPFISLFPLTIDGANNAIYYTYQVSKGSGAAFVQVMSYVIPR